MPSATAPPATDQFVHPAASHAKRKPPSSFAIPPINAFYIFLAANLLAAFFAPIQDCDETFNYWEPVHYLSHGYGLQTWEYSPDYAIRSWFYIGLHAIVGNARRLLPHSTKSSEFYFIRGALAFVCAICQVLLFRVVSIKWSSRIGLLFLIATVSTPGNFHSAAALLPSSFAMYTSMLGATAFMNWSDGSKKVRGIGWFAVGTVLGWPFAAALSFPYLLEEAILAVSEDFADAVVRVAKGGGVALLFAAVDIAINSFFYRKLEFVSWNIVKYNVFSSSGGPDLYGTEPWSFYFRNLLLNFNIWFVLALLAAPLFLARIVEVRAKLDNWPSQLRMFVSLAPFYLWLGIFTLQPHKEERFMYPAYPFLALNAAFSAHQILIYLGHSDPKTLVGKIPAQLKLLSMASLLLASLVLGLARTVGIYTAFSAPLSLYSPLGAGVLQEHGIGNKGDFVCYGKEWYRFPTSYFLPRDMHAKFIRSEFRGLLPGDFAEADGNGFDYWKATWKPTVGMNDQNKEDPGKLVDISECAFLVDTQFPENKGALPPNEPDYVADEGSWDVVKCAPFMDAANTPFLGRVLWMPDSDLLPASLRRKWGRHCLLKRKTEQ